MKEIFIKFFNTLTSLELILRDYFDIIIICSTVKNITCRLYGWNRIYSTTLKYKVDSLSEESE